MQQIPRASVHTALQRTPWNFSPEIQLSVEKKKKKPGSDGGVSSGRGETDFYSQLPQ